MAEEKVRARLGRGLATLIGDLEEDYARPSGPQAGQRRVPIEFLRRNPRNPRSHFDEDALDELTASIRERGVIQPILVRAVPNLPDAFEIIAGERRWRAAQRAGLHDVPVVTIEADDRTALELALIENVQRSDLNALEEAMGYEALISHFGYGQSDLAATLGKSRSHVANMLRLLKLPKPVQTLLRDGEISAGHARALLAFEDPEAMARRVVADGLNVREVERLSQERERAPETKSLKRQPEAGTADSRALEDALEQVLGLSVKIASQGERGELRIRYSSLEQLDGLCRRLRAA